MSLTEKETMELRIKCVEPFIITGSKAGLSSKEIFSQGEELWKFATATLEKPQPQREQGRSGNGRPPI